MMSTYACELILARIWAALGFVLKTGCDIVSPVSPEVANLLNTSEVSGEGFTTRLLQRNIKEQ